MLAFPLESLSGPLIVHVDSQNRSSTTLDLIVRQSLSLQERFKNAFRGSGRNLMSTFVLFILYGESSISLSVSNWLDTCVILEALADVSQGWHGH